MSTNQNNAKLGQKGSWGVTWPTFGILGPPNISGTVEAKNFKFGTKMDGSEQKGKMQNYVKRNHVGVTAPTFTILWPPNISVTDEARNFKFDIDMEDIEYQLEKCKIRS